MFNSPLSLTNKIISSFLFFGLLIAQVEKAPFYLTKNDISKKVDPNTRLKVNGKEVSYIGLDIQKQTADFTMIENQYSKTFALGEINKIHLPRNGLAISNSFEYASTGFKFGLSISKVLSLVSVYLMYDRENNDQVEITDSEKKYISVLMLSPICGALVGGMVGLMNPKLIYEDALIIDEGEWSIST